MKKDVLQLELARRGSSTPISLQEPAATMGYKYVWAGRDGAYLKKIRPRLILCGDYNIAHREIDIHQSTGTKIPLVSAG